MIRFDNTLKTLNEYGYKISELYKQNNIEAGYDPSQPLQNIDFYVSSSAGIFTINFNMPSYWRFAENGRGPGKMPPKGSLIKWMNFKRILPSPMTLSNGKTVLPSMESLEFLIRRKIGERGTQGQHTWEATENEIKSSLIEAIKDALTKDIMEYIANMRNKK